MAERVVSIKLVADASGVVRGFAAARDAAAETGKKISDSARNNREEWATVGKGLTAVGVAITGIGLAAMKTGIEYNTLQQTSRAALTTLLGSAKAANAQMDKLDEFARSSPFAKQTFIQAQQQMLAFGVETQKVLPYLDAVQNAVAAMGGSNVQIAEITTIMSKIQSSAKITATDLMQFGNHGVDAAALIGSQMGKTAGQIRNDITAGALDAGEALDALAAGMQERFGGAADNVKNTFAGAMDRVKAAWRDFASELAKPLVDPNGGGALVDLLNWTADAMRNFEKLPEPVKETTLGLTGLVGAATLAGGSFMLLYPKALELNAALKTLNVTTGLLGKSLGLAGLVIAAAQATAALSDWSAKVAGSRKTADDLSESLKSTAVSAREVTEALASSNSLKAFDIDAAAVNNLQALNTGFGDLQAKFEGTAFGKATTFINSLGTGGQLGKARENIEELDAAIASLVQSGDVDAATEAYDAFVAKATEAGWSAEKIAESLPQYTAAQAEAADATDVSTNALEELQGVANDTNQAMSDLADEILNFGSAQIDSEKAALQFEEQLAKLNERVASGAIGMEKSTEVGRENTQSLIDMARATAESAAATFEATGSQEQANAVLARGREALIEAATAYFGSRDAAAEYVDTILATPETVATRALLTGTSTAEQALANLTRPREVVVNVAMGAVSGMLDMFAGLGGKAYGGTVGYAQGGTILKAATGMTVPGLGGGVADGTVWGRGTSTSDSVLVRLSKGEEVIRASQAELHRPLLKSINRGDFVPSTPQLQFPPARAGGPASVTQHVAITQVEKDPRLVARQLGREIRQALT